MRGIQQYIVHKDDITSTKNILPNDIASFKGTTNMQHVTYSDGNLKMISPSCLECINYAKFLLATLAYADSETLDHDKNDSEILENLLEMEIENNKPEEHDQPNLNLGSSIDNAIIKNGLFV